MSIAITGYFIVNSRGYKTAIALSAGLAEGMMFVANPVRNRSITTLREMHHFVSNRLAADPQARIEDSEGNVLEQRELFDFAAYSRYRTTASARKIVVDKDGFKFAHLTQPEMNEVYSSIFNA
uniref:Uncharacterized protein n=2 Tax=unclassified Caudoviricetes TaxID=2788787 RepID=A0AAU8HY88_9CAUD